jgi:methylenetetrahydrofolate reductase (NADPH)
VHIGVAGPAKLQTLIKFAMACGVGPSFRVLQRRAADLTRLAAPFEPTEVLAELARHKAAHPDFAVEAVHFFPLGGIQATADYAGATAAPARARA